MGRLVGSHFSGRLGWTACALSSESKKEEESARAKSSFFSLRHSAMRSSVVRRKSLPAPCSVRLPTSSPSKQAHTFTACGVAETSARSEEYTLVRLSARGVQISSPFAPHEKGGCAHARYKSYATVCSGRAGALSPTAYRGRRSVCGLGAKFALTSRFMCTATEGTTRVCPSV